MAATQRISLPPLEPLDTLADFGDDTPTLTALAEGGAPTQAEPWRMFHDSADEYHKHMQAVPEHERNATHVQLYGTPYYKQPSASDRARAAPHAKPLSWGSALPEIAKQVGYQAPLTGTLVRALSGVPLHEPMRMGTGAQFTGGQKAFHMGVGAVHGLAELAPLVAGGAAVAGAAGLGAAAAGTVGSVGAFGLHGAVGARSERGGWEYAKEVGKQGAIGAATGLFFSVTGKMAPKRMIPRIGVMAATGYVGGAGPAKVMGASWQQAHDAGVKNAILFPLMHEAMRGYHGAVVRARADAWLKAVKFIPHPVRGKYTFTVEAPESVSPGTVTKIRAAWAHAVKQNPKLGRYASLHIGPAGDGAASTVPMPEGPVGKNGLPTQARIVVTIDPRVVQGAPRSRLFELVAHEGKHATDLLSKAFRAPGGVRAWFQERGALKAGREAKRAMPPYAEWQAEQAKRPTTLPASQNIAAQMMGERGPVPPPRTLKGGGLPPITGAKAPKPKPTGKVPPMGPVDAQGRPLHLQSRWTARGLPTEGQPSFAVPGATPMGPRAGALAIKPGAMGKAATMHRINAVRTALAKILGVKAGTQPEVSQWRNDPLLKARLKHPGRSTRRADVNVLRQELQRLYNAHPDVSLPAKSATGAYQLPKGGEARVAGLIGRLTARAPWTKAERAKLGRLAAPKQGERPTGGVHGLVTRALGALKAEPGKLREQSTDILNRYSGTIAEQKARAQTTLQNMLRNSKIPVKDRYRVDRDMGFYLEAKHLGAKRGSPFVPNQTGADLIKWFESRGYHRLAEKVNAYKERFRRQYMRDTGQDVTELEAHVARHWTADEGRLRGYAGKLKQKPGAQKHRHYETRWDALDDGLKPKFDTYTKDVVAHVEDFATAKAGRQAVTDIKALLKANPGILALPEQQPKWGKTKWRFLTSQVRRIGHGYDPKTGKGKAVATPVGEVAVHPDVYEPLQYVLNTNPVAGAKMLARIGRLNAVSRTLKTVGSLFHMLTLFENFTSSGGYKASAGLMKEWVRTSRNLADPKFVAKWAKHGYNLANARPSDVVARADGLLKRWGTALEMKGAQKGGGFMHKAGKAMRVAGQVSPIEHMGRALFDYIKPHLSARNLEVVKARFMKQGIPESEAMRMAATRLRKEYGQMQPEFEPNFWANPKVRAWGHAFLFSYSWTSGAVRQFSDIVPSKYLGRLGKGGALGSPGAAFGTQHKNALTFWLRFMTTYAAVHTLGNLYFTHRDKGEARFPWENPPGKRSHMYVGKQDDGKDAYMRFGKQGIENLRGFINPALYAQGKLSVPARTLIAQFWPYSLNMPTPVSDLLGETQRGYPVESRGTGKPWGGETTFMGQLPHRLRYAAKEFAMPFAAGTRTHQAPLLARSMAPTGVGMTMHRAVSNLVPMYEKYVATGDKRHAEGAEAFVKALQENGMDPTIALRSARNAVTRRLYGQFWQSVRSGKALSPALRAKMRRAGITAQRLLTSAKGRLRAGSLRIPKAEAMKAVGSF